MRNACPDAINVIVPCIEWFRGLHSSNMCSSLQHSMITGYDLFCCTERSNPSVMQEHRPVAQAFHRIQSMRHKHDAGALLLELEYFIYTLLLKSPIAHSKRLINEHNIRARLDRC